MLAAIADTTTAAFGGCADTEFAVYENLVDIKTVKLREGGSRLENAVYFLEQIKNPHIFRVGNDVVEICCAGEQSLSDVLVKHFNRKF